mmetsp:Transcript_2197/g.5079  ORF Transcript_2197/g.5079 Transcript_2197/m.5079 type:complete len:89 (-) Transcript_2197:3644-3910(-)
MAYVLVPYECGYNLLLVPSNTTDIERNNHHLKFNVIHIMHPPLFLHHNPTDHGLAQYLQSSLTLFKEINRFPYRVLITKRSLPMYNHI